MNLAMATQLLPDIKFPNIFDSSYKIKKTKYQITKLKVKGVNI